MSGPEGSSIKHCIVCAVGLFCPEHSTLYGKQQRRVYPGAFIMSIICLRSMTVCVQMCYNTR